jgi:hypothetical protein
MERVRLCWVRVVTLIYLNTVNNSINRIKVYFQSIPLTFNIRWLYRLKVVFSFKKVHWFNRQTNQDQQSWVHNSFIIRQDPKETTLNLCSQALGFFHHPTSIQHFRLKCLWCSSNLSTFSHSKWCIKCRKVRRTIISSFQSTNNLNTFNTCNLKTSSVYLIKFIKSICFNSIVFRMRSYFTRLNSFSSSKCKNCNGRINKLSEWVLIILRDGIHRRVQVCQVLVMLLATHALATAINKKLS